MECVFGIGGFFLCVKDFEVLGVWYCDCFGLDVDVYGMW